MDPNHSPKDSSDNTNLANAKLMSLESLKLDPLKNPYRGISVEISNIDNFQFATLCVNYFRAPIELSDVLDPQINQSISTLSQKICRIRAFSRKSDKGNQQVLVVFGETHVNETEALFNIQRVVNQFQFVALEGVTVSKYRFGKLAFATLDLIKVTFNKLGLRKYQAGSNIHHREIKASEEAEIFKVAFKIASQIKEGKIKLEDISQGQDKILIDRHYLEINYEVRSFINKILDNSISQPLRQNFQLEDKHIPNFMEQVSIASIPLTLGCCAYSLLSKFSNSVRVGMETKSTIPIILKWSSCSI